MHVVALAVQLYQLGLEVGADLGEDRGGWHASKSSRITGRKRKSPSCTNESPTPESLFYIRSRRTPTPWFNNSRACLCLSVCRGLSCRAHLLAVTPGRTRRDTVIRQRREGNRCARISVINTPIFPAEPDSTRRRKRKPLSGRRGRPPAGCPPARRASCGACLLFVFLGVCVCGKCLRRSTWRERFCGWPPRFRVRSRGYRWQPESALQTSAAELAFASASPDRGRARPQSRDG